ncbi:MAG: exodeoxyribonuclease VII large subunit [Candidatus Limiplasma sp.]|nr:exodeoxyribonuclease VII large subunit [Candidatus Limiplasma sp.]
MSASPLTLTVGELNEYVRRSLAADPMLHGIRLRGELSNFKRHVSGHWYFTLKDAQSAINCAMFRQAAVGVLFSPRDGQQVVLTGSIGLYAKTGAYQFYAEQMEQDGVGELYRRMEELKAQLGREGLFDPALKQPLPLLPRGIGIVTSGTGAVIHDIARVAWRRHPGMPLYLYPVAVQGEGAAEQIARALRVLDRFEPVDVLVVGRGGGSMEDLWAFNEEAVVRAIAACGKPVVSAVGHETDFTLADFAADVRAPTPSAAAEIVVPRREDLLAEVDALKARVARAADAGLARREAKLATLARRLEEQTPLRKLPVLEGRLQNTRQRLFHTLETALAGKERSLAEMALRIQAASPQQTLRRGYALVQQDGHTVMGVNQLNPALPMEVTLRDGTIVARALQVRKEG